MFKPIRKHQYEEDEPQQKYSKTAPRQETRGRPPANSFQSGNNLSSFRKRTTKAAQVRQLAEEVTTRVYRRPTDMPLVFLFRVYNDILKDRDGADVSVPLNVRVDAAKAAIPYLHKRLPIEVSTTSNSPSTQSIDAAALEALTPEELATLERLIRKLPAPKQGDSRPPEQQLLARIFEQRSSDYGIIDDEEEE